MDNKEYYQDLARRWFEAETTESEEQELRDFLAFSDDPDFDEVRAAFAYYAATGHSETAATPAAFVRGGRRWLAAIAVAASVAAAFFFGRMSATPVEIVVRGDGACYSYVRGVEVPGEEFAVREMESTLEGLFSPAPDPESDLSSLFSRK